MGITPQQLVPVKIGRREVFVTPEAAEAYAEREQEFARGITVDRQAQQELERLRSIERSLQQTLHPQPPQPQEDLAQVWYTDPTRAAKMVEERTERRLEQKFSTVLAERDFWDNFYRQHEHYRDDTRLVRMLAGEHFQELMALPTVQQRIDRLGQLTGNEILRISRKVRQQEPTVPNAGPTPSLRPAERPSGERLTPEPSPEDQEEAALPKTLGEAIRMTRAARAQSRGRRT